MPDNDKTQTFTTNEDGSYNFTIDGKPIRAVKESDLLAVKGGAEKKEGELLSQIAEANRLKDEAHNLYLQEQAAKEQSEEQAKEGATLKTKVGELETQLNATQESRKQLEEELLGMKRSNLAIHYKVSEESLKDKDMGQLKSLEDALQLVGSKGKPANYDVGPTGVGVGAPTTVLEQCKSEIAFAKEQQKRSASGDSDYQE